MSSVIVWGSLNEKYGSVWGKYEKGMETEAEVEARKMKGKKGSRETEGCG
jgi:hypothetical protein